MCQDGFRSEQPPSAQPVVHSVRTRILVSAVVLGLEKGAGYLFGRPQPR